jgi:hypothetical protein
MGSAEFRLFALWLKGWKRNLVLSSEDWILFVGLITVFPLILASAG